MCMYSYLFARETVTIIILETNDYCKWKVSFAKRLWKKYKYINRCWWLWWQTSTEDKHIWIMIFLDAKKCILYATNFPYALNKGLHMCNSGNSTIQQLFILYIHCTQYIHLKIHTFILNTYPEAWKTSQISYALNFIAFNSFQFDFSWNHSFHLNSENIIYIT